MNKIILPPETITNDNNNNNINSDGNDNNISDIHKNNNIEEQSITTELTSIPGVSSSFLIPNDDA